MKPACNSNCNVAHPCALCGRGKARVRQSARPPASARVSLQVSGPCFHLGDELTGVERQARGLDHHRRWAHCTHASKPLGEVVCGCRGCGPTCPGYSAEATTPPAGHRVAIGEPPPVNPTSDRLVCTVAVGTKGGAMLKATGRLMHRYARKVGADFLAITGDPLNPSYPLGDKFRLHHLTPHYERLLFVDADALVHPDAPDLFAAVPTGVGIRDDAAEVGNLAYLDAAFHRVLDSQGMGGGPIGVVLNSGVVLWGRDCPNVWRPPARPLPADLHVAEQCWVQANVSFFGYRRELLARGWNYQWWSDRPLAGVLAARPWILHMAGLSQMTKVPGWHLDPDAVRSAVLIAAAWAASTGG